jgi:outer membrane biosynthesis protein TonB
MRALRIWTDIVEWRWSPAVGLALGALTYVSLALLVIPDSIGDEGKSLRSVGTFQSLRNRTSAFAASIAPSLADSETPRGDTMNAVVPAPQSQPSPEPPVSDGNFPRRGFSPPLERAEPPPPPAPAPPAVPEIVVQPPPPVPPPPAPPPPEAQPAPPNTAAEAPATPPPAASPDPAQAPPPPGPAAAPDPGQPAPAPPPQ